MYFSTCPRCRSKYLTRFGCTNCRLSALRVKCPLDYKEELKTLNLWQYILYFILVWVIVGVIAIFLPVIAIVSSPAFYIVLISGYKKRTMYRALFGEKPRGNFVFSIIEYFSLWGPIFLFDMALLIGAEVLLLEEFGGYGILIMPLVVLVILEIAFLTYKILLPKTFGGFFGRDLVSEVGYLNPVIINLDQKGSDNIAAEKNEKTNEEVREEMINKLARLSEISVDILNGLSDSKLHKLERYLSEMKIDDVIVIHDNNIKLIEKERWDGIVEAGIADKFQVLFKYE